jgi:hypothetical protein
MRVGGRVWGRLAVAAGLLIGSAGTVWGQPSGATDEAKATPPPAPASAPAQPEVAAPSTAPDTLSPLRLLDGPSLRETGRIAIAPSPTSTVIENNAALAAPSKEKSIAPAASTIDRAPVPRPVGTIDPRVLNREIADHFQDIAVCRVDVARAKQLMPAQIVADKLLLRWIIEPDGSTGQTDVVAIAPVDLSIMDCAKRVMSQWTFTRPRGGPMTVERPFAFQ